MSKKRNYDILRWVILLPTVAVVWIVLFSLSMSGILYLPAPNARILNIYIVCSTAITAIAEFFIARSITPKYKKIMEYIIGICITLLTLWGWWGLAHMAY